MADRCTMKQEIFARKLLADREVSDERRKVYEDLLNKEDLSKKAASQIIEALIDKPYKRREQVGKDADAGYYVLDGKVFVVVASKRNPGRKYAKTLAIEGSRAHWVYAPGAQRELDGDKRLTVEEAARLGHLHGVCVICAKQLTDPVSVERGIGPVCIKRIA